MAFNGQWREREAINDFSHREKLGLTSTQKHSLAQQVSRHRIELQKENAALKERLAQFEEGRKVSKVMAGIKEEMEEMRGYLKTLLGK